MSFLTWDNKDDFVVGDLYIDNSSEEASEFVGYVPASEAKKRVGIPESLSVGSDDEAVLLFTYGGEAWGYTFRDMQNGITFRRLSDYLIEQALEDSDS